MAINKRLLVKPPSSGVTPSEHFGVVLYEGDGASGHSINGGKFGAAFYGNGSDSRIDVSSIGGFPSGNAPRSISFWMYSNSYADGGVIAYGNAATNQGFAFYISSSQMIMTFYGVNANINYSLSVDTWYHVVATFDGTTFKAYFNGSQQYSDTRTLDTLNTGFRIGGVPWNNSSEFFNGKLDQVRVFQIALSSSQVSTLYAETAETVESLDPLSVDTTDTLQVLGDTSCIATYRFENNEDDLSGNYDLTGNAIQYAAGRYGQAASFNGSSSYAEITSSPPQDSSGVMSVSFWAKTTSTSRACFFIAEGPSTAREFLKLENYGWNGTNSFLVSYNNNLLANIDNQAISDGNWHHIVITAGNGNVKTYKDNSLLATQSVTITDRTLDNFVIGYRKYNTDLYFNGDIDQFRIFNKELSAAEVTTLYNENPLVASYRFEGNANDDMRTYNGTASNVTYEYGLGFTPDFVWTKARNQSGYSHFLTDSTRGGTKVIQSNSSAAEITRADNIQSFDSDGFTLGADGTSNWNGTTYVAWCWKAGGGTTSSNTDGTITSTVQANTDAGFSIITYTGNGSSDQTVGHGLGVAPKLIIVKERVGSSSWDDWVVGGDLINNWTQFVKLNSNAALTTGYNTAPFSDTAPTSSVFSVTYESGAGINGSGDTFVAYAFAEIDGFSKHGSYTGNGSANGPIVETGFEPAFVMLKRTDGANSWAMIDNKRSTTNPRNKELYANLTDADNTFTALDFLSNGFQLKNTANGYNASGSNYIYMAFAADPDTEAPTVASSFNIETYTGNGGTQSIDGLGFSPNFVWLKERGQAANHRFIDTIRGATKAISSSLTNAEFTDATGLTSFDTDGFTLGNNVDYNNNGGTFVAWTWKADDNEATIEEVTEDANSIAIYKFEDNADDVTGNYDGTASNVTYASGKFNKAGVFNGTSAYIDLGSNMSLSGNSFSFSFWYANTETTSGGDVNTYVIGDLDTTDQTNKRLHIGRRSFNQKLTFAFNGNDMYSATNVSTDGTWQHWVCTFDASTQARKIYLNGSLDQSQTASANYTGTANITIGKAAHSSSYAKGMVDQVRVFNKELNAASVTNLYNETTAQNSTLDIGTKATVSAQSIVSANANAGFSIVKWTGTGFATKVPHGLSAVPEMIITKRLNGTGDWYTYHKGLNSGTNPAYNFIKLNSSDAEIVNASSGGSIWNSTSPSATVINVGTTLSGSTSDSYIAYCWHSVSGYSKIGTYTGTGSSGNAITGLGFSPDWILIKRTDSSSNWQIFDSVRGAANELYPNLSDAEYTSGGNSIDSDGFTPQGNASWNTNGGTFIYMAFKTN